MLKSGCGSCWSPMTDDAEFITRLTGFDLSEKDLHLYLCLLNYGAQIPSLSPKR
jgi:hypothetical protein